MKSIQKDLPDWLKKTQTNKKNHQQTKKKKPNYM